MTKRLRACFSMTSCNLICDSEPGCVDVHPSHPCSSITSGYRCHADRSTCGAWRSRRFPSNRNISSNVCPMCPSIPLRQLRIDRRVAESTSATLWNSGRTRPIGACAPACSRHARLRHFFETSATSSGKAAAPHARPCRTTAAAARTSRGHHVLRRNRLRRSRLCRSVYGLETLAHAHGVQRGAAGKSPPHLRVRCGVPVLPEGKPSPQRDRRAARTAQYVSLDARRSAPADSLAARTTHRFFFCFFFFGFFFFFFFCFFLWFFFFIFFFFFASVITTGCRVERGTSATLHPRARRAHFRRPRTRVRAARDQEAVAGARRD